MGNKTEYAGIDYGSGLTNIDPETGIRYGVINQNEVGEAWFEVSESHYGPIDCALCGKEFDMETDNGECPYCEADSADTEMVEPISFFYDSDGYEMEQTRDDTDIFVLKSPFYTYAQFCSPCAPGAGYLMSPLGEKVEGNKTFCLGHDWFEAKEKGTKNCEFCTYGARLKADIPNFNEKTFVKNGGYIISALDVECWTCQGNGWVINYVSKAPYKVYDVKTNRRIFPEG